MTRFLDIDVPPSFYEESPVMHWFALADTLSAGLLVEQPTRDPAQALFALLLIARACKHPPGHLVFTEHEEHLRTVLERFSKPIGGAVDPRYPFWRFQEHGFWRIESWDSFRNSNPDAAAKHAQVESDIAVGYCEERTWDALVRAPFWRYEVANSLLEAYWPEDVHADLRSSISLPEGPRRV